jgi:GntR family transcriptional regulator
VPDVPLDPNSQAWPYEQVAGMIRERIAAKTWGPKLPSIMAISEELDVAPNTVQRAIRELVSEGLVITRPGRGTFVRD